MQDDGHDRNWNDCWEDGEEEEEEERVVVVVGDMGWGSRSVGGVLGRRVKWMDLLLETTAACEKSEVTDRADSGPGAKTDGGGDDDDGIAIGC